MVLDIDAAAFGITIFNEQMLHDPVVFVCVDPDILDAVCLEFTFTKG